MIELPMFPLSTALFPGMALPLRLFEDRYLKMYADIVDADREFGVVLIERGLESREDNMTFDTGCVARIVGTGMNDDGTIALVAIGGRRLRVDRWLPSNPYPRAMVELLEDEPLTAEGERAFQSAIKRLDRLVTVASQLTPHLEDERPKLSDDPVQATYQMAQLAGLQAIDMQRVLDESSSDARIALVDELVEDTIELIRLQLDAGGGDLSPE